MFVRSKNNYNVKMNENIKKILSIFTYDDMYNSKLDTLYYNRLKNKFDRISYFLKRFDDRYILRDVVYSNIDYKHGIINSVKSSFIDSPTVYGKQESNILQYINNNFNDILHSLNNDTNIKLNNIIFNNHKKMKLIDNCDFLNVYDYIVENSNLSDLEIFLFESLLVTFTLPLVHIPIYLSAMYDWSKRKLEVKDLRILYDDIEMREYLSKLIKKINMILGFLDNIIQESIVQNKRSFVFMININFFELNLHIYDKNKQCEYFFLFSPYDYYRLLRILSSSVNTERESLYNDLIDISNKLNITTISNSINIPDSVEYLLEYFNFYPYERREYQEDYY